MYIPNEDTQNNSSEDYNQWLKRQDTQINEPAYNYSIKVPKIDKLMNKKAEKDSTFSFKEKNQLASSSHPIQQPKTYYERRTDPKYRKASRCVTII